MGRTDRACRGFRLPAAGRRAPAAGAHRLARRHGGCERRGRSGRASLRNPGAAGHAHGAAPGNRQRRAPRPARRRGDRRRYRRTDDGGPVLRLRRPPSHHHGDADAPRRAAPGIGLRYPPLSPQRRDRLARGHAGLRREWLGRAGANDRQRRAPADLRPGAALLGPDAGPGGPPAGPAGPAHRRRTQHGPRPPPSKASRSRAPACTPSSSRAAR